MRLGYVFFKQLLMRINKVNGERKALKNRPEIRFLPKDLINDCLICRNLPGGKNDR